MVVALSDVLSDGTVATITLMPNAILTSPI
jgi:hypothetical protein